MACPLGQSVQLTLAVAMLACASGRGAPADTTEEWSEDTVCYIRAGEYPNWPAALEIAKQKAACGPHGTQASPPKCLLPCNVCQFLEDGHFPDAFIVSHINGSIRDSSAVGIPEGSTDGVKVAAFQAWLCHKPQHVDTLAKAMVHEAIHLCKEVASATPAMNDGPLRGSLGINPWPLAYDTEDIVEECWR